MCTLTWSIHKKSYSVYFNRDERKQRQIAIPPKHFTDKQAIMPIDPDGKGTWIGVNQQGLSFAILNNYQKSTAKASANHHKWEINSKNEEFNSRGELITGLIDLYNFQDCKDYLQQINVNHFQPFLLALFVPEQLFNPTPKIPIFSWDGEQANFIQMQQPIISTSVQFEAASRQRLSNLKQTLARFGQTQEAHYDFHASHTPEPGPLSVCMHRDLAQTVSFSHIKVDKIIRFHYQPGAPCQKKPIQTVEMENLHPGF